LIKFLQDAAGKGELDPWDIDVISVIDSFLEQYSHTFNQSSSSQISYHKDLAETSEAFFAASVLVNLKAQVLESDVFKENSSDFEDEFEFVWGKLYTSYINALNKELTYELISDNNIMEPAFNLEPSY